MNAVFSSPPWNYVEMFDCFRIADVSNRAIITIAKTNRISKRETLANVRLATAAPSLYRALEDLMAVIATDALIPESMAYMQQARDALLQAKTGKPQT